MELIKKRQFYTFLEQLQAELREAQLTELEYERSGIVATYDALIDYFSQGADDPERERVYRQLVGQALLISDRCAITLHRAKELPYYTAQRKTARRESLRVYQLQLEAFAEGIRGIDDQDEQKQLAITHDKQLGNLFVDLWTQDVWSSAMASEADGLLLSSTITTADQCTIVSAVILSLLRMFDPLKLLFLCDHCGMTHELAQKRVHLLTALCAVQISRQHDRSILVCPHELQQHPCLRCADNRIGAKLRVEQDKALAILPLQLCPRIGIVRIRLIKL